MRQVWSIHEPCLTAARMPSGMAIEHGDQQAEQRQFGRCRQPRGEFGKHRPAGGERIAEIAVGEVVDVAHELLRQRLVQPERLADLGDRLRRRRGAGEIHRRIAGQHARQQKRDDDDADQRRNHGHEAAKDVGEHAAAPLLNYETRLPSRFDQRAVIDLPVEPVAVAGNVLLRRDVQIWLEQRHARHVVIGLGDEAFHVGVVFRPIADRRRGAGAVDEARPCPC